MSKKANKCKSNVTKASEPIVPWEYTSFDDTTLRESLGNLVVSQDAFENYYKVPSQVVSTHTKMIKMTNVSFTPAPIPRRI
jgi:hypothetical protein